MGYVSRWHTEIFFSFFPENRILQFMQIVSNGDNLHKCQMLFSGKKKKKEMENLPTERPLLNLVYISVRYPGNIV